MILVVRCKIFRAKLVSPPQIILGSYAHGLLYVTSRDLTRTVLTCPFFIWRKRLEYVPKTSEIAVEIRQPKAQCRFFSCCALFETTSGGVPNLVKIILSTAAKIDILEIVLGPCGDERNSDFD